jgi:tRNA A-37 threonylcarbamoyl transferase component Bud32
VTERSHEGVLGPGMTIGEFVIESVAGRGGMGVVYKARQREPDRVVALKVIAPELAGDASFEARFKSEGRMAARIEHPNVIPVYAVGEDRETLYIAMRFVAGTDLRAVIEGAGRIEPSRAALLIDQVARALDAAHAHGLVHRDVKPANILITAQSGSEHVYLTDFGLTRHVAASQAMTATGALVGTVDYVAPEQVRGERVDARTDVYSLGCVLFHSLTGRVPYPEDNQIAKLYAHDSRPPPSAVEFVPALPVALDDVIARAMAKAPDARYQSAGDLGAAALAAVGAAPQTRGERTVAVGGAAPARGAPGAPRGSRRRLFAAAAALVVLLAAAAVVALSQGGSPRKAGTAAAPGRHSTPAQRLLAEIPPATRDNCMPAAHGVADPSATASLECGLAGLDVVYQQFPNNAVMNQWYALTRENAGLSPASGSCTAAAFHGESRLTGRGTARGRYLCLVDGSEPRLYETDERFGVGTALDYYGGKGRPAIESLLRQWRCCTTLGAS